MSEGKKPKRLWRRCGDTPEGKYLVARRDGTIPSWPHFVLGARDPAAPAALLAYAAAAESHGYNTEFVADIRGLAEEFDAYREREGDGDPDRGPHRKDDPSALRLMRLKSHLRDYFYGPLDDYNAEAVEKDPNADASDADEIRPAYYGKDDPYEPWKVIDALGLDFYTGNAFKYLHRAATRWKEGTSVVVELRKCLTYVKKALRDAGGSVS